MKINKNIIFIALALIIGGGVGYFIGAKYAPRSTNNQRAFGQRNGQVGNRMGFRPVNGDIISADDKSITVKMQDGSSRIVIISDKTTINKAADATKADLKIGEKVAVFGQDNSDGSVTAQSIQLNPVLRGPAQP